MIPVTNLRAGTIFQYGNELFQVLEYKHQKLAHEKANIKVKVRNLKTGINLELGFKSGHSVEEIETFKKNLEFVYSDERKGKVILTDPEDRSRRFEISKELVGEKNLLFLKEKAKVTALILEETNGIVGVEIPTVVELRVTETGPSEKGDTATPATKPATLETGIILQVPMFIKNGDIVKVNTEKGEYVERIGNQETEKLKN